MTNTETRLRVGLANYARAMRVERPALDDLLHPGQGRPRRQLRSPLRSPWVLVPAAVVSLVLLLAVFPNLRGQSGDRIETSARGQRVTPSAPGGPSQTGTTSSAVVVVESEQIYDRAKWDDLRQELTAAGITFTVGERPVAPAAAGRIYSTSHTTANGEPPYSDPEHPGRLYLEPGDTLTVVVGVADEQVAPTEGLTLFEVWPELCGAIVWDDPQATAVGLQQAGFTVTQWTLITWNGNPGQGPTTADLVDGPQPGTRILSVLAAPNSSAQVENPNRRELMIELESAAQPASHPNGPC